VSFWDRLTGKVVEAAGLGQKKRAAATGITAFDGPISDLRLEIAINSHPWLRNTAVTALLLSVWAAQSLQDMAAILEATGQSQLGQEGKLPEATYLLADQLYDAALRWIDLAQTALPAIESDVEFVLPVRLPAPPPRLDWVPDAPPAHFVAVIRAAVQLGTATEDALNNAQDDRSRLPRRYDGAFETITRSIRFARAKLDQVEAAESDRQAVRLSQDIWAMLQEVVSVYFLAGQQIARPALIDPRYDAVVQSAARARRLPPPPAPQAGTGAPGAPSASTRMDPPRQAPVRPPVQVGQGYAPRSMSVPVSPPPPPPPTLGQRIGLGFDAWELTDRGARSTYQNDPTRTAELETFWKTDTNPQETHRLFGLITAAVQAGKVAVRPGQFSKTCPWIATFVALADVSIAAEQFTTGQLFTFTAGMDGDYFGRGFDRLGFLPGTGPPRPKRVPKPAPQTAAEQRPPGIDTRRRQERQPRAGGSDPAKAHASVPGIPSGADQWLLTAAFQRPQRRASPADTEQLSRLWRADPDPAVTIGVHAEVLAAVRTGSVRQHGDEGLRDCPWSQVYVAVRPVAIAGVQLSQNEKFALQIGVTDGTFKRTIARLGSIKAGA
jgi:hypothetical protein